MWAICAYFEPVQSSGSSLRLDNYRRFRAASQSQSLKLCVVELVYDDDVPALSRMDADMVIHVRTSRARGVLWQKERLLNIGLNYLPPECDKICWIDADIIFEDPDWVHNTEHALTPVDQGGRGCSVVQPFSVVYMLPRDWLTELGEMVDILGESPHRVRASSMFAKLYLEQQARYPDSPIDLEPSFPSVNRFREALDVFVSSVGGKIGMCWAAQRAIIEKAGGFCDYNVVGSGDAVMYAAFNLAALDTSMWTSEHGALIEKYLGQAHDVLNGARVGCVDGLILHMWHGKMKNRRYHNRQDILRKWKFDPSVHLIRNAWDVWEWSDAAPQGLIDDVRNYFMKRKEHL